MARSIFISLTHADTGIAEALRDALRELFGEYFEIHFSTSKELAGGIRSGEDWFQWIVDHVQECEFALILITPSSVHKPWILWEAGAVAGAALASKREGLGRVRPLVYQVPDDLIPSPIRDSKAQFRRGDKGSDVKILLKEILTDAKPHLPDDRIAEFGEKLGDVLRAYLAKVRACLLTAPAVASSVVIQEWLGRLDELVKQDRPSEVEQLHDWMEISFGRDRGDRPSPLDLRLHSRLAQVYLTRKKYDRAIEQLELARQLAPRDILILRTLGRAHLASGDRERAKEMIDWIAGLDPGALTHNAECAALAGRWHREGGDLKKAEEIYAEALARDADSYYLANLLAEVRLEAGRKEAAAEAFRHALAIIGKLDEANIWTHTTAANAAFFLGDDVTAGKHLDKVKEGKPDADQLATVERGLRDLAAKVDDGAARLDGLLRALRS